MEGDFIKINEWLLPLSWLYGLGVRIRNFMFEVGLLKSHSFDVPVISVGNITVGGTGKTPHVEYLIRLLKDKAKVAVLSRGYKRKTSGFVLADENREVRARYDVQELGAIRALLELGDREQLCIAGEDAPLMAINEDGVRRQMTR